jgi:hypothetical protein
MKNSIDFTRINNDTNGTPRYVCHFVHFLTSNDEFVSYSLACKRANKIEVKNIQPKVMAGVLCLNHIILGTLNNQLLI